MNPLKGLQKRKESFFSTSLATDKIRISPSLGRERWTYGYKSKFRPPYNTCTLSSLNPNFLIHLQENGKLQNNQLHVLLNFDIGGHFCEISDMFEWKNHVLENVQSKEYHTL